MDTDDLSDMAYKVLIMSESITHILTVEIGAMSQNFNDENSYLKNMLKFIRSIKKHSNDYIDHWGLEQEITNIELTECIKNIEEHISKTLATELNMRGVPKN